jgi:hypothetical protein
MIVDSGYLTAATRVLSSTGHATVAPRSSPVKEASHRVPSAKWLSRSLASRLAAVVTKALRAFGLADRGHGSRPLNLAAVEDRHANL